MINTLINPDFTGETPDLRLLKLGIPITPSKDEHQMVSIRQGDKHFYYGFKLFKDYQAFASFLMKNEIRFTTPESSTGARYPYHIGLTVQPIDTPTNKTFYSIESLNEAIESINNLKNIAVRAQDYERAATLRDLEKYYLNKLETAKKTTF